MEDKMGLLDAASSPRRATLDDAVNLSKLFASAFMDDPLFDYMVRPGAGRAAALEMFFYEILRARDIPQGGVWMSSDGHACVCWLKPDARRSPGGLVRKLSWLPFFVRVYSLARLTRGIPMMEAMEKNHPREQHFYLTFIAVSQECRGVGLGSRILKATLRQIDAAGMAAYVESSNPENATFYERAGFCCSEEHCPCWRPATCCHVA